MLRALDNWWYWHLLSNNCFQNTEVIIVHVPTLHVMLPWICLENTLLYGFSQWGNSESFSVFIRGSFVFFGSHIIFMCVVCGVCVCVCEVVRVCVVLWCVRVWVGWECVCVSVCVSEWVWVSEWGSEWEERERARPFRRERGERGEMFGGLDVYTILTKEFIDLAYN